MTFLKGFYGICFFHWAKESTQPIFSNSESAIMCPNPSNLQCTDFASMLSSSVSAMDLAKDQKFNFGDEIASGIRVAKKQV